MCEDRDRLIERIRKLLAVTEGRGATENEAVAAALAAQKLMAEYDIEQWELSDEAEPIESVPSRKRHNWQIKLAVTVADNFRCKCYHKLTREEGKRRRSAYIMFMGYRHDAEAARLVFERLSDIGGRKGREWARKRREELEREGYLAETNAVFNDYIESFIKGVQSVLEKQSQALMIVCPKSVDDAFNEMTLGTYRSKQRRRYADADSMDAGYRAGRDAVNSGRMGAGQAAHLLAE